MKLVFFSLILNNMFCCLNHSNMYIVSTTSHQTLQWRDKPLQRLGALKGQLFARPEKLMLICTNFSQIIQIDEKPQLSGGRKSKGKGDNKKCWGVFCIIFLILIYITEQNISLPQKSISRNFNEQNISILYMCYGITITHRKCRWIGCRNINEPPTLTAEKRLPT